MTLREVPVEHDDTVAIFCERYGCTADQIKLWNVDSADDINRAINPNIKSKAFYRLRRYLEKLKVPEEQAVAVEKAAAAANAEVNDDHLWLIYETRFNADDFKKLSKALAYGLYTLPLDPSRVEIAASRDMPEALRKAFFPFHTMERVQELSNLTSRWRKIKASFEGAVLSSSPASSDSGRSKEDLHATRHMVFPYNIFANDNGSYAIGTNLSALRSSFGAKRLAKQWTMWETASRSCIVKISDINPSDMSATTDEDWPVLDRNPNDMATSKPDYKAAFLDPPEPSLKDKPFELATMGSASFSVKTGVRYIGNRAQGSGDAGGGKDVLETNALLASMRSEWIETVDEKIPADPNLIMLRELLTVTYPNPSRGTRDGFQVRDLRPLDSSKIYFPPLSIPFAGQDIVDTYHRGRSFEEFWESAYVKVVAAGKAKLMLRYGLQLTTPNPQNFLLEFERGTFASTGTLIVRDLGDAKLHSEAIANIPCAASADVINYELKDPDRPGYLPAQTNNKDRAGDHEPHYRFSQYPLDSRLHWQQYSSFKNQYGGAKLPRGANTVIDWGRAHHRAYFETVLMALGKGNEVGSLCEEWYREAEQSLLDAKSEDGDPSTNLQTAQRTVPELIKRKKLIDVRADDYAAINVAGEAPSNCERGIEEFLAEAFHRWIKSNQALLGSKWGKWGSGDASLAPRPSLKAIRRLDTPTELCAGKLPQGQTLIAGRVAAIDRGNDSLKLDAGGYGSFEVLLSSVPAYENLQGDDRVQLICADN